MVELPKVSINTDLSDGLCFGCGKNNPIGLKLSFNWDGKTAKAEFVPGELYQGWPGVVHGGIIISMLDEAMSYAAQFTGVYSVTAKMEIRLKNMASTGQPLIVTSQVTRNTRKLLETKARVSSHDGALIAEAEATHFVLEDKSGSTVHEKENPRGDD